MSEAHPTSPVSPEADNSGDIYNPVLRTIAQSEQRAALVPGLVRALLCSGAALCISLVANGIQYWHATGVTREYFATDNGRLVRLAPTSQPAWSQSDVMNFGSMTLSEAFNLDFVHYRKQITTQAPRFSEAGFAGYVNALQASNILDTIKKEKFNLTTTIGQVPWSTRDRWRTASGSGNSSIRSGCAWSVRPAPAPNRPSPLKSLSGALTPASNPAAWKSARWFPVTPQQESETHIMHIHHLIGALLIVCGTVTAADNPGWKNARSPQTGGKTAQATGNTPPAAQLPGNLPPPSAALVQEGASLDSPLNAGEIRELRGIMADNERAISAPLTSVVPRISSLTVNLSPGASLPLVRTALHNVSVVTFTDVNGSPWPQSDPPYNAAPGHFDVQFNGNMVSVTPLRAWAAGNVTVYLKGLSVPVILNITSGETDTTTLSQEIDSRLDLRIPRQGPASPVVSIPSEKIALHDATLQAFLDGVPPDDPAIRRLKFSGNVPDTTIWQHGDDLLVRSRAMLRDEFEQTLASADGTRLWKLPVTPLLTFSVNGQSVHVTPELE
ncbi:IncI1 plasmid conjugative transfer protein TraN [Escherichia coli IS35]|nr:IncI1 plasmid conjugative transfer protein TraN [Escherichia coli IS35]